MMVKFQLNDISPPLTLRKLKEKLGKGKLEKYIKNNIDFESKKLFTTSNGEKLSLDFEEGNMISEQLLKNSKTNFLIVVGMVNVSNFKCNLEHFHVTFLIVI